jgi:hypothetical protein
MDIKISMKDSKNSPETKVYHGNSALEQMFKDIAEKYFGKIVAKEIQNVLSKKITDEEINKAFNTPVNLDKILNTEVNEFITGKKRSNK